MTALTTKIYNAYTSLMSGVLSMVAPTVAGRFRFGRDMYRAYTSGQLTGPDKYFNPRRRSADADVKAASTITAARCRDQAQNNSLISGAIDRIANNVVRDGIYPQFLFRDSKSKLDKAVNTAWSNLFRRWGRYCDSKGHDSYGALQILGLKHMWVDGQYLIHRVYDDSLPGIVPLRLELLECDHLDKLADGVMPNGNVARKGIEYNGYGRPVAYHILDHHPGDYIAWGSYGKSRRIPAADIIHVWDREMISQFSGISWLHAVVLEGYRMDDFRHLTQDNARAQAIFAYFLKSSMPGFGFSSGIPAGGQASPYAPANTGGAVDAELTLNSTTIQKLPTGTDVQTVAPSHPGNNYEPFVKDSGRYQSAGIGMSFEGYTNNYTDASYASARSGSLEERLSYRGQQRFIEEKTNERLIAWFIEAAWMFNMAPVRMPGYAVDPLVYHEMAAGQFPGWGWVDPMNDARASEKRIDLTISTHTDEAAQAGKIFEDVVERQMEEEKQLIELAKLRAERMKIEQGTNNATTSATAN